MEFPSLRIHERRRLGGARAGRFGDRILSIRVRGRKIDRARAEVIAFFLPEPIVLGYLL